MKCGAECQHAFRTERDFIAVARIIFRNLNFFWRIAVPAVLDNRASRLLAFRHGDEISGRRSGPTSLKLRRPQTLRARSGAGCSSYAAIAGVPVGQSQRSKNKDCIS